MNSTHVKEYALQKTEVHDLFMYFFVFCFLILLEVTLVVLEPFSFSSNCQDFLVH